MRSIVQHLGSLALSLLMALFVWVASVRESNPTVRGVYPKSITLEVKNKPAGLEFIDPSQVEQQIQLVIAAPQSNWENLTAGSFQVWIDLQGLSADMHEVEIQAKCSDKQVRIENKQPASLSIRLEPLAEKEVDVHVKLIDDPALGYVARTPETNPSKVKVVGPASTVDRVAAVIAEVSLQRGKASIESNTTVIAVDDRDSPVGWLKRIEPSSVLVSVAVDQKVGYKDASVSVVRSGKVASGYRIAGVSVEPSIVTVVGSPAAIEKIPGYVETQPVDISGAKANVSMKVALVLPEGASPLDAQMVQVDITVVPLIDSISLSRKVVVQGQRPGSRVTISPETVEVIVSGAVPRLETLTSDEVPVVVELTDLAPGVHKLRMKAIVPEGLTVESIIPDTVQVEIVAATETPTPSPTPTTTPTPSTTPTPWGGLGPVGVLPTSTRVR